MDRVTELIAKLKHPDWRVRREAAMALKKIEDAQAVPGLIDALKHPNAEVGIALWKMRNQQSVPALMEALRDSEMEVRSVAEVALGGIQDIRAIPALVAALADKDESLIWCIHGVLRRLGTASLPALIDALMSREEAVRWNATVILGEIGNAEAVPALVKALKAEVILFIPFVRADWAFLRIAAKTLSAISVRDPDPVLRSALPTLHYLRRLDPGFEEALYFQEAIDKIEAATAATKELPLPTAAPLPDARTLPLPAIAPSRSPDTLPIPAAARVTDTDGGAGQDRMAKSRLRWLRREKRH